MSISDHIDLNLVSGFLRELGLIAPLLGHAEVTIIANAAAAYLDASSHGYAKFAALTSEMKARREAGVTTTAAEILADVDRIKDLDKKIQGAGKP